MQRPPDLEMRRAAPPGSPVSQQDRFNATESNAAAIELQAQQLRTRFALGYCLACSLAPLIWGLPR